MLFDVAALLTTSAALGPVAEAFSAHEISALDTSLISSANIPATLPLDVIDLPALPPEPFVGPQPAGSPGELVQGTRLLQQIALLPTSSIGEFIVANPDAIAGLMANPPAATDVSAWWGSMGLASRNSLRAASPQLVGNLDGIPFAIRDVANREVLQATMAQLDTTIATAPGRSVVDAAKHQLSVLQSIADALAVPSETPRTLMSLDPTGQGRAAIIMGDLRTADYVTYMVPGMFFTIEGQMVYWSDAAARMGEQQLQWLAHYGDTDSTVATIAWIGYHTPNLTNIGSLVNAEEGRDSLAGAIEGLQALRAGDEPYISVIGHSYGSTAALMALTEYDFEIDALAVVGSPGSAAQSVDELHVRDGNVFVGEAAWDPVPTSAFFGSEPGAPDYGATVFGTAGGVDPITGATLLRSFGHIEYFSPNTESLRNLALITIGHGADILAG
ncbi:hypothetical protein BH10ACT7_BH10ACT7_05420 [soil metagenome]